MARFAFLEHDGPIPFAHRGGGAERPENTWAAFSHARDLGYRYVESDVHATADGVAVLIHDPRLDRVADRPGTVAELTWREVSAARLGGDERVPRLDEVLAAWPDTRWNLDAKADSAVPALVEALRRCQAVDRVCVTAFDDRRVGRVRAELGPRLCTATGPRAATALRLASMTWPLPVPTGAFERFGAVQVPPRWGPLPVIDRRLVATARRAGLAVHAWTVNDPAAMTSLLDTGVDGLMTDRPAELRRVLAGRGQWRGRPEPFSAGAGPAAGV